MSARERSFRSRATADELEMTRVLECIRQIGRTLRVGGRAAEQSVGVSGAQLLVLQQLQKAPAQSLNELAGRTLTHQSSVSVVVSRLVERRLVTRTASPDDGRRVVLSLTPAGRAVLAREPEAAQTRLVDGLRRLPQRRVRELSENLRALVATMEAADDGNGARRANGSNGSNGSGGANGGRPRSRLTREA
jgi:MarR family transcriptional regulator, lower aerobic nicotinate degradation pathway regulator